MTLNNKSFPSSASSDDLAADMREAALDRAEQVADELREMGLEDEARRDLDESELAHDVHSCMFCESSLAVRDLGRWLAHMARAPDHEFDAGDLYVVSRTLALLDDEGRRALGMFALVGDAALTYAVVNKCFDLKYSKSKSSDARSRCTAWSALARVFVRGVPSGLVLFPAGVDPGTTRAGGEALEAFFGLIARDLGESHVSAFAVNVGAYSSYKFE